MKNLNMRCVITFILSFLLNLHLSAQSDNFSSEDTPYDYLIGKEYSKVYELGDFAFGTSGRLTMPDGYSIGATIMTSKDSKIITSEQITWDDDTKTNIRKILDIIVVNKDLEFSACEGCLIPKKKNYRIKTLHKSDQLTKESIIVAFMRNQLTGKYVEVNPAKFEWNPNR